MHTFSSVGIVGGILVGGGTHRRILGDMLRLHLKTILNIKQFLENCANQTNLFVSTEFLGASHLDFHLGRPLDSVLQGTLDPSEQ